MPNVPTFSLVMATVNRSATTVERFLRSLSDQTERNVELIVVDQNSDERLAGLLRKYSDDLSITHLRSMPGLSRARNCGLRHISGDYCGFPDDDCWYPPRLLEVVGRHLASAEDLDGLTTRMADAAERLVGPRWAGRPGLVDKSNVWRTAASPGVFLRRSAVAKIGLFDESLGAGSAAGFGSGEETDYLIRAVALGMRILYCPALLVHHEGAATLDPKKARRYGMGMGRVLRKHSYPLPDILYHILRPAVGSLIATLGCRPRRAAFHASACCGRLTGYWPRSGRAPGPEILARGSGSGDTGRAERV
jgi:GT2 family glycosyltransferase